MIIGFPVRAVQIAEGDGGWWVLTPNALHWRHRHRWQARQHAAWLAAQFSPPLPVREHSNNNVRGGRA